MLGVGHGVTDDGLHEGLEDTAGLLGEQARAEPYGQHRSPEEEKRGQGEEQREDTQIRPEAFDAATACQAADAGLVMPWMLSRSTLRWRLAPPFRALASFPRPDIVESGGGGG